MAKELITTGMEIWQNWSYWGNLSESGVENVDRQPSHQERSDYASKQQWSLTEPPTFPISPGFLSVHR